MEFWITSRFVFGNSNPDWGFLSHALLPKCRLGIYFCGAYLNSLMCSVNSTISWNFLFLDPCGSAQVLRTSADRGIYIKIISRKILKSSETKCGDFSKKKFLGNFYDSLTQHLAGTDRNPRFYSKIEI